MKLNRVEKALMNNPLRSLVQWHYEAPLLERLGGPVDRLRVLEVGCGRGVGTEILLRRFGAAHVTAFDVNPDMVAQARRRLADTPSEQLVLYVGDASRIAANDETFDAVFEFGTLHHADWPRWSRSGGYFGPADASSSKRSPAKHCVAGPIGPSWSTLETTGSVPHEFVTELKRCGIVGGGCVVERIFGDFVIGVGRRDRPVNIAPS